MTLVLVYYFYVMGLLTFDEFILTNYCETSSDGFDHVGYIRNWMLYSDSGIRYRCDKWD